MERFSYKGGCGICKHRVSKSLKEELAWAIDKRLQVVSYKMLFKTVRYTTKKLNKKAVLNLKQ